MDPISGDVAAAPPDANSTGKILVKLKLPPPPENQGKSHYCKECNKGFTSGKALGGHMSSAHVQANKDYSDKKLASKKHHHRRFSGTAAQITCNICARPFRSEKSLFGHMRCHPERCYRGMEPPVTSSEEDSGGFPPPPHVGCDLKSWPAGVKRGRGPIGALVRAPEEDNALASVHEIVRMVGNGPVLKKRDSGSSVGPKVGDSDEESAIDERVKTAAEVLAEMGGKVKCEKLYRCDSCNVSFGSHQALGGHRSSHTNLKLSIADKLQSKMLVDGIGGDNNEKVVVGFDLNMMPEEED